MKLRCLPVASLATASFSALALLAQAPPPPGAQFPAPYPQGPAPQNQGQFPPPGSQQGNPYPGQPSQDPPSRVARLNLMNGQVSFQPAGIDTWTAATLNYPLTTGDHLYTDVNSLAEMHIGPNAIRLNSQTNFGFLNLDDRTVQMRFAEGAMEVRLRGLADQDLYEIDTPNGAVSLLRTGEYRLDTDPARNATMVTVIAGEAEVTANGMSFPVHPRQTAYFAAGPPDIRAANPPDEFDRFTSDRNMREDRVPPPQHVSQSMVGYEDLNAYGQWRQEPGYGWVWVPPVPAGWAPYHNGHWAWVEPWGWTWIDDAPWGFAPFHYGRWALVRGGWVWIPGTVGPRPVYAPALVAFVGGPRFGVALGLGAGIGAVAWFPLGPQEVFRPAYRVSPVYVTNVNVVNVTNVTNITTVTNVRYVNQSVPGAVTAVPQAAFVGARPVGAVALRVGPEHLAQSQVLGSGPAVVPQRESLLGPNANANVARPPQAIMARQVVTRTAPPPAPVPFQARQAAIAQNGGQPLAPAQVTQLRQQQPAAAAAPVNRMDSRPPGARPMPGAAPAYQQPAPAAPAPAFRQSTPAPAPSQAPAPVARPAAPEARPAPSVRPAPAKKTPPKKEREEERR